MLLIWSSDSYSIGSREEYQSRLSKLEKVIAVGVNTDVAYFDVSGGAFGGRNLNVCQQILTLSLHDHALNCSFNDSNANVRLSLLLAYVFFFVVRVKLYLSGTELDRKVTAIIGKLKGRTRSFLTPKEFRNDAASKAFF